MSEINSTQQALIPYGLLPSNINDIMAVEQEPKIRQQLEMIRDDIKARVENALSLAVTEETVKTIKTVRADLSKGFKALEDRRKEVKKQVLSPYEEFEAIYKECVTAIYAPADTQLKARIDEVENGLKEARRAEVSAYFDECCTSRHIDFLTFKQSGMDVNLTASKKSLKEQARAYVDRVAEDLEFIATQEHEAETLVEYKKLLNAVQAVTVVKKRFQELEAEKERVRRAQEEREAREQAARRVEEAMRQQASAQASQAAQASYTPPGMAAVASMLAPAPAQTGQPMTTPPASAPMAAPLPAPTEKPVAALHEQRLTAAIKIKNANAQQIVSAISILSEHEYDYTYEITVTDTRARLLFLKRALMEGGCELE